MNNFNEPLLAESSGQRVVFGNDVISTTNSNNNNSNNNNCNSTSSNNNNNNTNHHQQHHQLPQHSHVHQMQAQQQHQQHLLTTSSSSHHQKDQMLAAGSTPILPFLNYAQLQQHKDGSEGVVAVVPVAADNNDFGGTLQPIDGSHMEGGMSLGGLCERIFASPNPHSNSNQIPLIVGAKNNNSDEHVGVGVGVGAGSTVTTGGDTGDDANIINGSTCSADGGGAVVLESVVSVPSFANLLFPNRATTVITHQEHQHQPADSLNSIDPTLLQKSSLSPTVEYHQLKPLDSGSGGSGGVSTSGFLNSTTAQLLDFEVTNNGKQQTLSQSEPQQQQLVVITDDVSVITVHGNTVVRGGSGSGSNANGNDSDRSNNRTNNNLADNQISTTTATVTGIINSVSSHQQRSSLHSIEELAASSKTSVHNNNNSKSNTSIMQQHQLQGSHSASNVSSEDESMSEDEFGLEIDDQGGYQDTTSSHSQQSGGGGGGNGNSASSAANAALLNGGVAAGPTGGYMLLPPTTSSSGHLTPGGVSGAGGSGGGSGGGGGNGSGHGGTSATSGVSGEAIDFKHLFEELCPVCGDKVSGYHYGLLTCESCKGFFKRTVQNKKVYTCVAERSCHIDKTQRKRCPYCRFQKCLDVGMKLEAVRADRMRGGRNKFGPMYKRDRARKLQVMRQRQLALQALRSSMGTDIKPTPLSPGYQQAYPNMNIKQEIQIPQVSSLTQSPDSSPSPIAIALGQVNATGGVIATPMNGGGGNGATAGNTGLGGSSGGSVGNGSSSNNNSSGNGGGGGGNNAGSGDGLQRSGGNGSGCPEGGNGSLQNTAESKLCFDSGTHPSSTADALIEPLRVSPMIREFVQSIDDREWQTQLFALLQKQTYNQVEVDLFELMCKVLDQNLFSQVDWARNTVFFKDLKVDDQMKLLQHSWSDMLVLDHLHHRIHNGLPDETQLNNGQVFNLMSLGLLGVPQLGDYFNELQNKLQDLKFDMGDYVCMKFLILLNPDVRGIINKKTVLEGHENVQAALLDYTLTCYPSVTDKFRKLLNILPEIHAMAARGEEHLYSKHCEGNAPSQTLLMEMLHAKRKV